METDMWVIWILPSTIIKECNYLCYLMPALVTSDESNELKQKSICAIVSLNLIGKYLREKQIEVSCCSWNTSCRKYARWLS